MEDLRAGLPVRIADLPGVPNGGLTGIIVGEMGLSGFGKMEEERELIEQFMIADSLRAERGESVWAVLCPETEDPTFFFTLYPARLLERITPEEHEVIRQRNRGRQAIIIRPPSVRVTHPQSAPIDWGLYARTFTN
jgi:hypothetical protein